MGAEVTLQTRGHVSPEDIRDIVASVSGRDAALTRDETVRIGDDAIRYFTVECRDPENRRKTRELRGHHSERADSETEDGRYVGEGPYTALRLGAFGGASVLLRAVAERFGGAFVDEAVSEHPEFFDFPEGDHAPGPR